MAGRAKQLGKRGDHAQRCRIADAVMDRLGVAPGCQQTGFAHPGQMLRQRGLRQPHPRLQLAHRKFAIGKLAQDHQPVFVSQQPQQLGGAPGALLKGGEIELSGIEHGPFICIDSNLAIPNIEVNKESLMSAPSIAFPLSIATRPAVQGFFDQVTNTVSYIVHDPETGAAAIIDPVLDFTPRNGRTSTASADALLAAIEAQGLTLAWLLETHAHADHLSAAHYLRERTGAPVVIGARITEVQAIFADMFEADDVARDGSAFDRLVAEGDVLPLGAIDIRVMHTPGHTPACVTYLIGDAAFIGDTLFMPDYGTARTDFPGGNAQALFRSVHRLFALPAETRLFTGHDYLPEGRTAPAWEASVAQQRADNIHINDTASEAGFVAMREARDATLEVPYLILPSLQVNIRAGAMPPASPGGHTYLRLPINAL